MSLEQARPVARGVWRDERRALSSGGMWLDIVVAAALALVGAVVSWQVREYVAPMRAGDNQWFQSDLTTVWLSLTDRFFDHRRTNVHPLFPLVHTTSVYALRGLFDVGKAMAVGVWISAWASAWAVVCYAAARLLRFARRESLLIAVLMLGSASALCWTSVPETRTVGSLTILLCVIAAAASERRSVPDWVLTGVVGVDEHDPDERHRGSRAAGGHTGTSPRSPAGRQRVCRRVGAPARARACCTRWYG